MYVNFETLCHLLLECTCIFVHILKIFHTLLVISLHFIEEVNLKRSARVIIFSLFHIPLQFILYSVFHLVSHCLHIFISVYYFPFFSYVLTSMTICLTMYSP